MSIWDWRALEGDIFCLVCFDSLFTPYGRSCALRQYNFHFYIQYPLFQMSVVSINFIFGLRGRWPGIWCMSKSFIRHSPFLGAASARSNTFFHLSYPTPILECFIQFSSILYLFQGSIGLGYGVQAKH